MDGLMNEVEKYGQSCPERRKELADFGVCVCVGKKGNTSLAQAELEKQELAR